MLIRKFRQPSPNYPSPAGIMPRRFMMPRAICSLFLLSCLAATSTQGQGIREHTRPGDRKSTAVSDSQATDLTLTLNAVSLRPIQTWVRTAGRIDKTGKLLTAQVRSPEAGFVKVGQRVRAFPPASKSSMFQAWVTKVVPQTDG